MVESRRLVNGIRALALDDLGLAGAVEQLVQEEKTRAGWGDAEYIHNIAGRRFDKTLETAVYRVAQEALTNAHKHAQTAQVSVLLLLQGERLTLEVRDRGRGFETAQPSSQGHIPVGLQSMAERVRLFDGVFDLWSRAGEGTRVRAVFSVEEEGEATEA